MSIFEIISAIVLILACAFIVVVILLKDTKTQMSQQISGTTSDSFYQKNVGRTKEAILNKATIVATVLFFVLAVAVNLINVYSKNANADSAANSTTSAAVSSDTESDNEGGTSAEENSESPESPEAVSE